MTSFMTAVSHPRTSVSFRARNINQVLVSLSNHDDLIAAIRAKVKATLPELVKIPETLSLAQALKADALPFLVIVVGAPTDVSSDYAVFDEAQQIPVDLVYVAKTATDGATDTAQTLRRKEAALMQAFLSDRHLGGIVTRTEVDKTAANKANEYESFFANVGEFVTLMVLTMQFTVVQSTVDLAS